MPRPPTRARRRCVVRIVTLLLPALAPAACGGARDDRTVITFPMSAVGAEARVLQAQLARFAVLYPDITVRQRPTPDAADQRHQLYVQWLNAHAGDPDVLQLDVIWTSEFAAAGWLHPLEPFGPPADSFFAATIAASRWAGRLYALPWFADVGLLYWRTDLLPGPPATIAELDQYADDARRRGGLRYGFVWQGARYEGLVTVFLERLAGFGGRILDDAGRVVVDGPAGVRALESLREEIHGTGVTPEAVLTWQEEQTRFAFQNGNAVMLRNWPYAYPLLQDSAGSPVAGKVAVAPMPGAERGRPVAALGGSLLAINARSRHPQAAYALIRFLTAPAQMLERARLAGQYPTRPALYDDSTLAPALPAPPRVIRGIVEHAVPRPATPVYTELSGILQVWLHRALSRQVDPAPAMRDAAREMRSLLERVGLAPPSADAS